MRKKQSKNKNNQVMCSKCCFCGIGIGVSLVNGEPFRHDQREPNVIRLGNEEIFLCDDCLESFSKSRNKDEYIKKLALYGFI